MEEASINEPLDVVVIGGGQAGLVMGYYLRPQGSGSITRGWICPRQRMPMDTCNIVEG